MNKSSIIIIDYGMGNIRSVLNKIHRAGHNAEVSYQHEMIEKADKLILPGVGHFSNGMKRLKERNLLEILNRRVLTDKIPILGICLGMQLLTLHSEEGDVNGLGWIDAETIRFRINDIRHKVPHMGWNSIEQKKESRLLNGIPDSSYFYFVHSYHVKCNKAEDILTTSNYVYDFVSAVEKENIFGTQFHPEKSHGTGERMLNNFLNI
jgi:imidazole glycerol-phosphate synthase subunit HisH